MIIPWYGIFLTSVRWEDSKYFFSRRGAEARRSFSGEMGLKKQKAEINQDKDVWRYLKKEFKV